MLRALRTRLDEAAGAFASNFQVRDLRRAQLSFAWAWSSEWTLTVGLGIIAFRDGGAAAVGLVALVRLLPGAVAGPLLATLADRFRRERVIAGIGVVRAASIGLSAVLLAAGLGTLPVYALAVAATVAGTPFRAAHSALLPSLCTRPEQLTSANAVRGMLDSLSTLLGPLAAAVLLEVGSPAAALAGAAAASLLSALLVLDLRYEVPERTAPPARPGILAETAAGIRTLAGERDLAVLFGMAASQTFTRGCLNVLVVVAAIELLDMGEPGVAVLSAAVGVGAVLGSLGASLLSGSHRLGIWYGASIVLWGLPLAVIGAFPVEVVALLMLAAIGLANALLDVAGFTLFARMAPNEVLARVLGVFEALVALSIAIGSIVTPLVIDGLDVRGALVMLGAVAPLVALAGWARLLRVDRMIVARDEDLDLLGEVPLLRPLPLPVMEHLARNSTRHRVPAGEAVCRQGDVGDSFYVIASGEADVAVDGEQVAVLRPGEGFGEIALLRDVPRVSTVRAAGELELLRLPRGVFVPAVTGYSGSKAAADAWIGRIMDSLRPRGATI